MNTAGPSNWQVSNLNDTFLQSSRNQPFELDVVFLGLNDSIISTENFKDQLVQSLGFMDWDEVWYQYKYINYNNDSHFINKNYEINYDFVFLSDLESELYSNFISSYSDSVFHENGEYSISSYEAEAFLSNLTKSIGLEADGTLFLIDTYSTNPDYHRYSYYYPSETMQIFDRTGSKNTAGGGHNSSLFWVDLSVHPAVRYDEVIPLSDPIWDYDLSSGDEIGRLNSKISVLINESVKFRFVQNSIRSPVHNFNEISLNFKYYGVDLLPERVIDRSIEEFKRMNPFVNWTATSSGFEPSEELQGYIEDQNQSEVLNYLWNIENLPLYITDTDMDRTEVTFFVLPVNGTYGGYSARIYGEDRRNYDWIFLNPLPFVSSDSQVTEDSLVRLLIHEMGHSMGLFHPFQIWDIEAQQYPMNPVWDQTFTPMSYAIKYDTFGKTDQLLYRNYLIPLLVDKANDYLGEILVTVNDKIDFIDQEILDEIDDIKSIMVAASVELYKDRQYMYLNHLQSMYEAYDRLRELDVKAEQATAPLETSSTTTSSPDLTSETSDNEFLNVQYVTSILAILYIVSYIFVQKIRRRKS